MHAAFGLASGEPPDRYIVGLAALSLVSEIAAKRPLLCVVDDAQWLDPESKQALAFVARRLGADSVGLLFACREYVPELERIDELQLEGLGASASRALLDSVVVGPVDDRIREQFLAESHGNPLALIELSNRLTSTQTQSGRARRSGKTLSARIEQRFTQQLESLPDDTRRLLVLAAAEPLGDPQLLFRGPHIWGWAWRLQILPSKPDSFRSASVARFVIPSFDLRSTAQRRPVIDG